MHNPAMPAIICGSITTHFPKQQKAAAGRQSCSAPATCAKQATCMLSMHCRCCNWEAIRWNRHTERHMLCAMGHVMWPMATLVSCPTPQPGRLFMQCTLMRHMPCKCAEQHMPSKRPDTLPNNSSMSPSLTHHKTCMAKNLNCVALQKSAMKQCRGATSGQSKTSPKDLLSKGPC
jgi:hypothetical protein